MKKTGQVHSGSNIVSPKESAVPTVCCFCHKHCGIIAYVKDGVLQRVKADPAHPASRGDICPKVAAAREVVYSPDRLKYPLRKTKSGFQRISWDEALDIVSSRLLEIRAKYGAETLARCQGAPVSLAAFDCFRQLLASYGSANSTGAAHLCHVPRMVAFDTVYGGMPQPDYENTGCMIVWGCNPIDTRAYEFAFGRYARLIPQMKKRGAKLIVIDPMRTSLADLADKWLAIEPGTDDALALAMLNVIISEGLYDKEFVAQWTVGFEQLAEHVEQFTPEWAQDITRLPANEIREVARLYATTKPASIRDGNSIDMYPKAVQTARAIGILCAVTGNLDVKGGNVFFPSPNLAPRMARPTKAKRMSADKYPLLPEIPFPYFMDAVLSGEPYKPRAMFVHHANPALINADSARVRQALEGLELLVVCDIFKSATAELADIILPEASDYERYGVECYASAEGGFVALMQRVIEPVGESRPVFEIEYELAKRMGLEAAYPWTNTEEWINYKLKPAGITLEKLRQQPVIYTTPPVQYKKYLKNGFNTPSGKVELYSQRLRDHGYPPLPPYKDLEAGFAGQPALLEKYPLIGTSRKIAVYVHTRFRNIPSLRKIEPEPLMRIHPQDAQPRGVNDGDLTAVESPKQKVEIKAKVTTDVLPGVIAIDFGWGNPWDPGPDVNILTSDEDRDPISGSTPNRRFRCQVAKANSSL